MGHEQILVAVVVEVAGVHAHARFGIPVGVQRRSRQQSGIGQRAVAPVHPELVLVAVVRDVDVGPAVAVEVGRHHAERRTVGLLQEGDGGDVVEPPVATVAIQAVGLGSEGARVGRSPVMGRAVVAAARSARTRGGRRDVVAQIVAHVQVQPPVAVVVHEGGGHAPSVVVRSALTRPLDERAVAVVPEELVASEVRQVEVDPPVVVHVPGGEAHAVPARVDAALLRDVREPRDADSIGLQEEIVAVQAPRGRQRSLRREQGLIGRLVRSEHLSLDEVDVEVAVVVVVEQPGPRRHDLGNVERARRAVEVDEVEAARNRGVDEPVGCGAATRHERARHK